MRFADWMILVAVLLPYLLVGLAKAGAGIDNARPRADVERLEGWRRRAEWAHHNHFEALPGFAAAVIVAQLTQARPGLVDALAGAFILFRLGYSAAYVAGWPPLRSACWLGGILCVIALFCSGV